MVRYLITTSLLGAMALASPANAQIETAAETPNTANADAPGDNAGPGDIIVTARRRADRLLDVPLSIQAMSNDQLAAKGIDDLTSLQFSTPGFMTQTNNGFTQIYMRGVGNSIFLGADPSVAMFVDDVPRIYGSMADNLVDVERIEVLKGAQGGLYGRNATGGVVNIVSRQPSTDELTGNGLVSYGERKTFRTAAFVNVPVGDSVAFSISGERASHAPYIRNPAVPTPYSAANFPAGSFIGTPQATADYFNSVVRTPKLADQDFWFVRGKLLLQPTDNLKLVLSADYSRKDDNLGTGQVNQTPSITQATLSGLFTSLGIVAALPDGFVKGGEGAYTAYAGFPAITPLTDYGFSATATLETGGFEFTSITAHREQRTDLLTDVSSSNVPSIMIDLSFKKSFTYQELRAVSTFEGPFSVIFGGTYLKNRLDGQQAVSLLHPSIVVGDSQVSDRVENWSVYVSGDYALNDVLTISASGRYMRETNEARFTRPITAEARTVQDKFIPSLTLTHKLDGGNVYLRWARGFKTGGINLATASAYFPRPQDGSIFGPETVDTFEAGYKQALLNGKLQVTTAVFYNNYKNLQVDTRARPEYPQLTTAIINAQSARTLGAEATVNWRASPALTLGASAGYLDAKYKDFRLQGSAALIDFDQSGMRMPKAPEWQLSFSANLDQPVSEDLRLVASGLLTHVSSVIYQRSPDTAIVPDAVGPGYWLANARVGLKTADDRYGLALIADNIFNKAYYVFGQSSVTSVVMGWGTPRVVRGEITAKF